MVASTRNLPSTVIDTMNIFSGRTVAPSRPISPSSQRQVAWGLAPGSWAALRNPWGLIHMSSCHTSAWSGCAATGSPSSPSRCQATSPLT